MSVSARTVSSAESSYPAALVREYALIRRTCASAGLSPTDADDVAQDVVLWLLRNRFVIEGLAAPWLIGVARNFILRFRRAWAVRKAREAEGHAVFAENLAQSGRRPRKLGFRSTESQNCFLTSRLPFFGRSAEGRASQARSRSCIFRAVVTITCGSAWWQVCDSIFVPETLRLLRPPRVQSPVKERKKVPLGSGALILLRAVRRCRPILRALHSFGPCQESALAP